MTKFKNISSCDARTGDIFLHTSYTSTKLNVYEIRQPEKEHYNKVQIIFRFVKNRKHLTELWYPEWVNMHTKLIMRKVA